MMMLSPLLVAPFVSIAPLVPMSIAAITGIVGTIAPVVVISGDAVPSGPVIAVMSARSIMAATPAATITMMLSHCGARYRKCEQRRSEEHTSELQSLMRISYAVFCLKKNKNN